MHDIGLGIQFSFSFVLSFVFVFPFFMCLSRKKSSFCFLKFFVVTHFPLFSPLPFAPFPLLSTPFLQCFVLISPLVIYRKSSKKPLGGRSLINFQAFRRGGGGELLGEGELI